MQGRRWSQWLRGKISGSVYRAACFGTMQAIQIDESHSQLDGNLCWSSLVWHAMIWHLQKRIFLCISAAQLFNPRQLFPEACSKRQESQTTLWENYDLCCETVKITRTGKRLCCGTTVKLLYSAMWPFCGLLRIDWCERLKHILFSTSEKFLKSLLWILRAVHHSSKYTENARVNILKLSWLQQ